jgi:hypothetical protein
MSSLRIVQNKEEEEEEQQQPEEEAKDAESRKSDSRNG